MKAFTWFLLFIIALLGAFGYYLYRYVYVPKNLMLVRLSEENLKLKYEIKDKVDRAYKECGKGRKATSVTPRDTLITPAIKDTATTGIPATEPLVFSFAIKDLFKRSRLSSRGKALVREFYSQIKDREFDSVRIVINRKNAQAARKVLNIKQYLVSLGLKKDKVWARLSGDIPRDSVRFKLLW